MSLGRRIGLVSTLSFGVSVAAFAKNAAIAARFGVTGTADLVAYAETLLLFLPTLLLVRECLGLFVSVYARVLEVDGEESASRLYSSGLRVVALAAFLIALTVMTFPTFLMRLVAPGLAPDQIDRGAWFLRMISPAFLLQEIGELAKAVHNAHHRYVAPGLTMLLGNVLQVAILVALPVGQAALAWVLAIDLAALLQALILVAWIPGGRRPGLVTSPAVHPALKDLGRLLGPAALGVFLLQIAGYIERAVLSYAPVGSIATIVYARKLTMPIQTILAASVALPLYVQMSRTKESEGRDRTATLGRGIEINFFLFLPITAYVLLFAPELVAFAFRRGLFDTADVAATVPLLRIGVLAILPASLLMILRDFFYASSGTWPLAAGGAVHLIVTAIANLALAARYGILWIPIGIVAAAYLTLGILVWIARGRLRGLDIPGILRRGATCLVAASAAVVCGAVVSWSSSLAGLGGWTAILFDLAGGGIVGLGAYVFTAMALRHPAAGAAWERVRRHG